MIPALLAISLAASSPAATLTPLPLPGGAEGIGFDDLLFAPALGKVLAPAGRTGKLDLVDPRSRAVESIGGFSTTSSFAGGHGAGTTSADFGAGLVFASDRGKKEVVVIDPARKQIVATAKLEGGPDYVRFVAPNHEVWVSEPSRKAIEVFTLETGKEPKLTRSTAITFDDGPESLVVDATRGRAYSHSWKDVTYVIDLAKHAVVARWKNGCGGSRGIALDEPRALLFVGCDEGRAVALDVAHEGARRGEAKAGKGVDIIAYAPALRHLYVPGGDDATLTVMEVGEHGELTPLQTLPTAEDAHCVAADDQGNAYVCDPKHGQLLVLHDAPAHPAGPAK